MSFNSFHKRDTFLLFKLEQRIFHPKSMDAEGEQRKQNTESLHDLYYSPDIIAVTKWRRTGWSGLAFDIFLVY
jgi:hypothetical protein